MLRTTIHKAGFAALAAICYLIPAAVQAQEAPTSNAPLLMAAGSLRAAMDEMLLAYRAQGGAEFVVQYGPSGKLRQEIEAGKKVDVFASAAIEHTYALANKKLLGPSHIFTHNDLCVIARSEVGLNADNLIQKLIQPKVRVATSTPVADPMGDYTWQFFRNADKQQSGTFQTLNQKALKLSGATAPKPGEKLPYVTAFEDNKADAYVMYCTNAVTTKKSLPQLQIVRIPDGLNVRSAYGIVAHPASVEGNKFVLRFVKSKEGQQILNKHGFY